MTGKKAIRPDRAFLREIESRSEEKPSLCYQCRKCTNGCPLAFAMEVKPNQVMRMISLGLRDELLRSNTIWICASCQTCTARCPNDIDIAHVMDTLRQECVAKGITPGVENVLKFHKAFLASVRMHGRVFELGMTGRYKLDSRDFFSDAALGLEMFKKGKLDLLPHRIAGRKEIRDMFDSKRKG